jgi:YjbE family integral membrane protein
MPIAQWFEPLVSLGQIVMIDLIMAGDNAIIVGMAAASVPAHQRKRVIVWGTAAAVALRILFALVALQLLEIIGLTLAGGLLLAFVVYQMFRELRGYARKGAHAGAVLDVAMPPKKVGAAVWQVAMADLSMSLDNVLGVAGAARGHMGLLVAGLLISVVMMAFAATAIAGLIHRHRWVAWLGLAVVAYVAADMIARGVAQVAEAVE